MSAASKPIASLILALMAGIGAPVYAQMAEDGMQQATDGANDGLFQVNPAFAKPGPSSAGLLLLRRTRSTKLDQSATGNDTISNKANDDYLLAGGGLDLGAGAALGASHQVLYRKVLTELSGRGNADPVQETMKAQHSQVRLLVELADGLKAGLAIRYLYKDFAVFGDPFLQGRRSTGTPTRYRTTLVGYGSGFAYNSTLFGLGYAYYPPLRGKTDVEGEEKIVIEPGQINADFYYRINPALTVGLLYKRWINEIDDLAAGTTASDNQTRISLYGLDLDQYLYPVDLMMIGGDLALTKQMALRLALGRETSEFNFKDLMRYNRLAVRSGSDANQTLSNYRVRAAVSYAQQGYGVNVGGSYCRRQFDFPTVMNGASYDSSVQEIFAELSLKL